MSTPASPRRLTVDAFSLTLSTSLGELRFALRGLALQPSLALPVSFMLDVAGAPWLRAELPRVLPVDACEKLAHEALDATLSRLHAPPPANDHTAPPMPERIAEAALHALTERGIACERSERGCTIRGGDGLPTSSRIVVEPLGGDQALQVASEVTLRVSDPSGLHAMARHALELNQRLRLARVAVDGINADAARIVWQAVLPSAVPIDRGLVPAVEAIAVARNLSSRVFAALSSSGVASAYLGLRFADDPGIQRHISAAGIDPAADAGSPAGKAGS